MGYRNKQCILCGQIFEPKSAASQRCDKCKQGVCANCGKAFTIQTMHQAGHFCSVKCYLEYRWQGHNIECRCPTCGKKIRRIQSDTRVYCSAKCSWQAGRPTRRRKRDFICAWCGTSFSIAPSARLGKRAFCSHSCSAKWWAEFGYHGADHPNWRGGYPNGYEHRWIEIRKKMLERVGEICQSCKKPSNRLEVHHLIPLRCFKQISEAHFEGNLIVLCVKCHRREHRRLKVVAPLLDLLTQHSHLLNKR